MKSSISRLLLLTTVAWLLSSVTVMARQHSNEMLERTIPVKTFTSINNTTVCDIHFTPSNKCEVRVKIPSEYSQLIDIYVKGSILYIGVKPKNFTSRDGKRITAWVKAPRLDGYTLTGIGDFDCTSPLKTSDFTASVKGAGNVSIRFLSCTGRTVLQGTGVGNITIDKVEAASLNAEMKGSGDLSIKGNIRDQAEISNTGVGNVKGVLDEAQRVTLTNNGTGNLSLTLNGCGQVDVTNYGTGDTKLKGSARSVNSHIGGVGSLHLDGLKTGH